jgi:hypothetical protein
MKAKEVVPETKKATDETESDAEFEDDVFDGLEALSSD